ncbi:MAG: hypothetical protein NWE94_01845 [Candidatus Bathyarchaeota archaeon]|nr:hypothetical protein [Candidatus Bathyarchaeota archaeon]
MKSYVIAWRNGKAEVLGSFKTNSHAKIEEEFGLKPLDDCDAIKVRDRVFVEVTPPDPRQMMPISKWTYTEDEQDTLPEWYLQRKSAIEEAVFMQLVNDVKVQVAFEGEEKVFKDVVGFAVNPKKICVYGSSTVEIITFGSSTAEVNIKSPQSIVRKNGKICVNTKAAVITKNTFTEKKE